MRGLGLEVVHHAYGAEPVLRGVSLGVAPGELACLLGPSGCGKTTLLRLAAGLETLQRGWITIGERLVADAQTHSHLAPEERGVGLMFQDYALFPHLTIFENITFGMEGPLPERHRWAAEALERMGLARFRDAYPHTLSGGQQQRVALLRALAPEPGILLLDEPFSGLDVTRRAQVREDTLALLKETGVTTLMVTHDPEEAMYMADRIMVMDEGRIIQAGSPEDTYFHPVNAFVAALFGPVNRLSAVVGGGRVRTPLGAFDAPGMDDGTVAEILIRPEGIDLGPVEAPAGGAPAGQERFPATVLSARLLGRSSHVRLRLADGGNGPGTGLRSRMAGVYLPAKGSRVWLTIDSRQAFVFPRPAA